MKLIVLDAAQAELEEAQTYYLQHATPDIAADPATGPSSAERRNHTRLISVTPAGKPASSTLTS